MGRTRQTVDLDKRKLRAFMQARRLTASELSEQIGASRSYIANLLNGSTRMSMTAYKALCAVLEVPKDTFTIQETPEQPETGTLASNQLYEIADRLDKIEQKLDKLLGLWGDAE